ncbi:unnamed protein product [Lota lota]
MRLSHLCVQSISCLYLLLHHLNQRLIYLLSDLSPSSHEHYPAGHIREIWFHRKESKFKPAPVARHTGPLELCSVQDNSVMPRVYSIV